MTATREGSGQAEALALRHVQAAERAAGNPPGIDLALARPVERVLIVGGGLMGCGIAAGCLVAGLVPTLIEQSVEAADQARDRVAGLLDGAVRRGKMTDERKAAALKRLNASADVEHGRDADLAIEAVFEDLSAKRDVFRTLAAVLRPETPIATNTSYLDPIRIAEGIDGQGRVLGLHFFSPAHVMKLVEVVRTPSTSEATLATGFAFAQRLGKIAVPSGICDGFIGNRLLQAYRRQADYLLLDGCLPHEIDRAMCAFGMPMGPYQLQDLTGLQIAFANRKRLAATRDPAERYVDLGDRLCEAGRLGQRAGKGWYRYEEGDRTAQRDEEVERLIEATSTALGIERRTFSSEEIQNRLLAVLINEGGHVLDEGIAARPSDIDLVEIHGYGFPKTKGGPMFFCGRIGRDAVRRTMFEVAGQSPHSWRIARYLQKVPSDA